MEKCKLTPEERDHLHKAIDAARGRGGCQYSDGAGPCCVIGQFAHLQGIPNEALEAWDEGGNTVSQILMFFPGSAALLRSLPLELMERLQQVWDNKTEEEFVEEMNDEECKKYMHSIVDRWEEEWP